MKNSTSFKKGVRHLFWKGNKVGYDGLHAWIRNNFGKANKCEWCKTKKSKRYEWANKGKYNRNRKNWVSLCTKCHNKLDRKNPEFCKCGKPYFAKGMCRRHYGQNYYLLNKQRYVK